MHISADDIQPTVGEIPAAGFEQPSVRQNKDRHHFSPWPYGDALEARGLHAPKAGRALTVHKPEVSAAGPAIETVLGGGASS
jgi:hypothetical protein